MSKINDISPLSKKEVEIISDLEFNQKYYFTKKDIKHHFDSESKLNYTIHRLIKKHRIVKLNRNKYYLIPIKAKSGSWVQDSFILADEMFNGMQYYIGGWAAANFWGLTEQVPMKIEVFTNKRNGSKKILYTEFIFKKTTQKRIDNAVTRKIKGHPFKILRKKDTEEWLRSRNY